MPASKKTAAKKTPNRWSRHVNETSDAMDLKPDVFKSDDPEEVARSLKKSAEHSDRRKAEPFRSAMSMLNFYINRAGHNLKPAQHRTLEKAKDVLRELFGRADGAAEKKASGTKTVATKTAGKKTAAKKTATETTAKKTAAKKAAKKTAAKKAAKKSAAKEAAKKSAAGKAGTRGTAVGKSTSKKAAAKNAA